MNLKTLLSTALTALLLVTTVINGRGQIIISQYYEGTSNNKWIELTNVGTDVDLTANPVHLLMVGSSSAQNMTTKNPTVITSFTSGTWTAGTSKLIKNSSATLPSYAVADISNTNVAFNGAYDVVFLSTSNSTTAPVAWNARTDMMCEVVSDLTTATSYADISYVRNQPIVAGNTTFTLTEWTTATLAEVESAAAGTTQRLGFHAYGADVTAPTLSTTSPIDNVTDVAIDATLSMTFSENIVKGTGNITIKKVSDDSAVETIDVTTGAVVVAGATATITPSVALTKGVEYYVTVDATCFKDASANPYAGISDKTAWTFTTIAAKTGKAITAFSFAEQTGAATIGDGTIAIEVASSATVNNLVATFTVSDGANVKIGAVDQVSATTPNDFTSPVTYTVTAEDGSTKDWVVTVTKAIAKSTETDITAFSFVEQTGPATIDAVNHTIAIEVGATTDITTLAPSITLSAGATVNPLSGAAQNFTSPVVYTVTAEDGTTTQNWTVTVTLASTIANTTTLAEKYYAGDNLTVTWTSANLTNVKVEWFDGTTWSDLATSVPATDGQYVIAIPAASKYGTAYKFRISDAAKATVKAESNAITIIAVVNNITEFKTLTPNDIAKIKGEVFISFIRSANRNQKYIQDAEGGLLVDDPTPSGGQSGVITTAYAEKDGITGIEGKLVMYGTYTYEIVPTVDPGAKTSSNNTLTPKVITLAELKADHMKYQSMLVKVQGVTIKEANGTAKFVASSGASNYTMQLGAEEAVVRQAWKTGETDLIDATIPVGTLDIVGIVGQFTTGTPAVTTAQLQPRRVSDISVINGVETNNEVVTKAFPNPFSTDFKINAGKVVRNVVVSNMLGQKVMERTYNEIEIEVPASDLRTGVYFVTVKFEDGTTSTLRMVKK